MDRSRNRQSYLKERKRFQGQPDLTSICEQPKKKQQEARDTLGGTGKVGRQILSVSIQPWLRQAGALKFEMATKSSLLGTKHCSHRGPNSCWYIILTKAPSKRKVVFPGASPPEVSPDRGQQQSRPHPWATRVCVHTEWGGASVYAHRPRCVCASSVCPPRCARLQRPGQSCGTERPARIWRRTKGPEVRGVRLLGKGAGGDGVRILGCLDKNERRCEIEVRKAEGLEEVKGQRPWKKLSEQAERTGDWNT